MLVATLACGADDDPATDEPSGDLRPATGTPRTPTRRVVSGLLVGLSFIGRPLEDATVLALGHVFEQL